MKNKSVFLILGNQLFPLKYIKKYKECNFFMCEDYELCTNHKHHKLKLILFLSAMRSYADKLIKERFHLHYINLSKNFKVSYEVKLEEYIKKNNINEIKNFEIEDKFFEKKIHKLVKKNNLNWVNIKSPMFLFSRKEFKKYLDKNKKPIMGNFYKISRKKNKFLVVDGRPKGGKWSFDEENRKKITNDVTVPLQIKVKETEHTKDLKKIISKKFPSHPGSVDNFWIPTTENEALKWLDFFIEKKLNLFGDYEDTVDHKRNILFHSALSPLINIGLITPEIILAKLKKVEKKIKTNSFEGYARQIIGWREFIRGIYQNYEKELKKGNFFKHKRNLNHKWYDGTTGLEPLDHSIKNAVKYGWSHHIERLMILSNIMNLCEIHPKSAYIWFMEMFIDSSDWVMTPNLFGMGFYSDGGIFASKPYICASSYFLKMMNFKKGEWCEVLDGLYWRFIHKNRSFFLTNPRLSMMVKVLDKMNLDRKKKIIKKANNFILNVSE